MIEAIFRGRSEILQTRLSVSAVQIVERLRIRAGNLNQLLKEELEIDNALIPFERGSGTGDFMGLERLLTEKRFQITQEKRQQDVECWRDLVQVMRDFLNDWEGLTQLESKQRFLKSIPAPSEMKTYTRTSPLPYDDPKTDPYYPR